MILNIDEDAIPGRIGAQTDLAAVVGEFEGILEEVANSREKQVAISIHGEFRINHRDVQGAFADLCQG